MAHDLNTVFGELRACLANPGEEAWRRLCRLIDAQPVSDELVHVVIPYLRDQLDATWPDTLRRAPTTWLEHERRRMLSPLWVHASLYDEDFYYGDGVLAFQEYAPWWAADAVWSHEPVDHAWARDAGIFALLDGKSAHASDMATLDLFDLDQRRVSAKITGPPWATTGRCALSDDASRAIVLWVGDGRAALHSSDLSPRLSGKRISWEHQVDRDITRDAARDADTAYGVALCVPEGPASWVACSLGTWVSICSAHTGTMLGVVEGDAAIADVTSATLEGDSGPELLLLVLDHQGDLTAWGGLPRAPEPLCTERVFGASHVLQSDDGTIWAVGEGKATSWRIEDGEWALDAVHAHASISSRAMWRPSQRGIRGVLGQPGGGVLVLDLPGRRQASLVIDEHAHLLALSSRGQFAILGDHTEVHLAQLDCAMARAKVLP